MIAKLFILVLKSSFLIVNAILFGSIMVCCSDGKKKSDPISPPRTEIKKAPNSTTSTEKDTLKSQNQHPPSTSSTPSLPISKPKTPDEQPKLSLKLQKTQPLKSKESLRPPPRTIRGKPIGGKSREAQKTMKDVKEFSAREGPLAGEKSANQQDFDDYLNNLGENKN
uniref:Uncharacterized protein n=1 Tax=Caenorhabditis tropicalis TaxID=1561998 RepID=A0A1I7T9F5_9PELO